MLGASLYGTTGYLCVPLRARVAYSGRSRGMWYYSSMRLVGLEVELKDQLSKTL